MVEIKDVAIEDSSKEGECVGSVRVRLHSRVFPSCNVG